MLLSAAARTAGRALLRRPAGATTAPPSGVRSPPQPTQLLFPTRAGGASPTATATVPPSSSLLLSSSWARVPLGSRSIGAHRHNHQQQQNGLGSQLHRSLVGVPSGFSASQPPPPASSETSTPIASPAVPLLLRNFHTTSSPPSLPSTGHPDAVFPRSSSPLLGPSSSSPTVGIQQRTQQSQSRTFASKRFHRKKIIKMAKGYRGRANRTFRAAIKRVEKAMQHAYRHRKVRKRDFRRLWIQRINAGVRQYGVRYSRWVDMQARSGVRLDRKVLSELAMMEPFSFRAVVDVVKARTEGEVGGASASAKKERAGG